MLSLVPSTDISVLYPGVMSITEYATIVPSTDNSVLFSGVMSTTKYVIISTKYIFQCTLSWSNEYY